MYKLFHQLDRQEKAQKTNLDLRKLEALYNNDTYRRDSFSTITTRDPGIILQDSNPSSQPVTWGEGDGCLPVEISFPESDRSLVVGDLHSLDRHEDDLDDEETSKSLPTSLFVDDDEDLNLVYKEEESVLLEGEATESESSAPPLTMQSTFDGSDFSVEDDVDDADDFLRFETERFTRFEI
eukprot:scaffold1727_cov133-Cylindrotheca_fusiformis.AAC.44